MQCINDLLYIFFDCPSLDYEKEYGLLLLAADTSNNKMQGATIATGNLIGNGKVANNKNTTLDANQREIAGI